MRTRLSFSVGAITLSLVVAWVDHRLERICGTTWQLHMGITMVKNGGIDLQMMSPSQIAEAQKLARAWSVRMSARQS